MNPDEKRADEVAAAIEFVANRILGQYAEDAYELWDCYPEIGLYDWERVVAAVQRIAGSYEHREYLAAYDLLAARAEGAGGTP